MKKKVQEQIEKGYKLNWESYKLLGFEEKFSDTIFTFQEKVDDVLSCVDKIDGLVCFMETCEYKSETFKAIFEQIQTFLDAFDLHSYSNLPEWVRELDLKVCATHSHMHTFIMCSCIHVHIWVHS